MAIAFKTLSELTDSDKKALFEWGEDVFHASQWNLKWRGPEIHIVGYLHDMPMTHVGVLAHEITVGSAKVRVGGIGGVVTVAQGQKKGYARECLLRACDYLKSKYQTRYALLFCADALVAYYGGVGFKKLTEPVTIDQPGGKVRAAPNCMVLEFSEAWPEGPVDLESLPW